MLKPIRGHTTDAAPPKGARRARRYPEAELQRALVKRLRSAGQAPVFVENESPRDPAQAARWSAMGGARGVPDGERRPAQPVSPGEPDRCDAPSATPGAPAGWCPRKGLACGSVTSTAAAGPRIDGNGPRIDAGRFRYEARRASRPTQWRGSQGL